MIDPKNRRWVESLGQAFDDEPIIDEEARAAVRSLGINTTAWAAEVRKRVVAANEAERKERFDEARRLYQGDLETLNARKAEPVRSLIEQRAELRKLIARAPREMTASMHAHKFEEATEEELAEMIRSLRYLLRDDEEP